MSTWVVGDIHGCYDDFMRLLSRKEIGLEDRVILIGDIIDRGPDSYKMLNWAMKNVSKTGRFQMICGNHEDNIIRDYDRCKRRLENGYCMVLTRYGFGFSNVQSLEDMDISALACDYDFVSYMEEAGYETVASVKPIVDWFKALPLYKRVRVKGRDGKEKRFVIAHGWYGENMSRDNIVWYRDVDTDFYRFAPDYDNGREILIHGHTPTPFCWDALNKKKSDVFFRERSINIDCGCVFKKAGGKLAAIRLEDMKVIYIQ